MNSPVFMADDSEVQPDAALFRLPAAGVPAPGVRLREDSYLEGTPELIVEIAASSTAYDLYDKMDLYREVGGQEYIVWQVLERRIDWCRLREGRYIPLQPDAHGVIEREVFPGLRLDVTAMLAGDRARVLATLNPQERPLTPHGRCSTGAHRATRRLARTYRCHHQRARPAPVAKRRHTAPTPRCRSKRRWTQSRVASILRGEPYGRARDG